MLGETLLKAYLDANILLAFAIILWSLVLVVVSKTDLKRAYRSHLWLLNGVIISLAFSPVLIYFLSGWSARYSLNLTDIIVAQYLEGNVEISPSRLVAFLSLRENFVRDLIHLQSPAVKVLAVIFFLGFVGFSIRTMRNALRLRNTLKNCRAWRRFGRKYILLSDTALVPFSTRSLSKHYIVIPTIMLDNSSDIKMAIGHELQHFRQRDVEWAILLELLTPLFFWNPLFYIWKRQVTHLREFACDQNLLERSGYDVRSYCECLLRTCSRSLRGKDNFTVISAAVAMVNVERVPSENKTSLLRSRIIAITSDKSSRLSKSTIALIILPLVLTVTFSAFLIQAPADWSHDRLMLSTIVNLERMDARNSFDVRPSLLVNN